MDLRPVFEQLVSNTEDLGPTLSHDVAPRLKKMWVNLSPHPQPLSPTSFAAALEGNGSIFPANDVGERGAREFRGRNRSPASNIQDLFRVVEPEAAGDGAFYQQH